MKNAKRLLSLLCAAALVSALSLPAASAAETQETVIDLGNGYYVVETITEYRLSRDSETKHGSKSDALYQGSTLVGTATLYASFDLSGATAKATQASISGSGSGSYSYTRGTTRLSGNTAYGTAYFSVSGAAVSLPLHISLSCSPDGTLS